MTSSKLGERVTHQKSFTGFSFVAETALQLVKKRARKEFQNVSEVVFDASFDGAELRRNMKELADCKLLLDHSSREALPIKRFTNKIAKNVIGSSLSEVMLYRTDFMAVLRKQLTIRSSQGVSFSLQTVPKETKYHFATLQSQDTYRKLQEGTAG